MEYVCFQMQKGHYASKGYRPVGYSTLSGKSPKQLISKFAEKGKENALVSLGKRSKVFKE